MRPLAPLYSLSKAFKLIEAEDEFRNRETREQPQNERDDSSRAMIGSIDDHHHLAYWSERKRRKALRLERRGELPLDSLFGGTTEKDHEYFCPAVSATT